MEGVSRVSNSKEAVAAEVWHLLGEMFQKQFRGAAAKLQEIGLTPGHLKVLMLLSSGEAMTMGSLAQGMSCDASTMTWLIDRLEEGGLVERDAFSVLMQFSSTRRAICPSKPSLLSHVHRPRRRPGEPRGSPHQGRAALPVACTSASSLLPSSSDHATSAPRSKCGKVRRSPSAVCCKPI